MFSRRPAVQQNRGRISVGGSITPLTILGTGSVLQWCRSDLGISVETGVSAWADQSTGAHNYVQGTAGKQPLYSASGGPNGVPYMTFDGTDDELVAATLNLATPSTTPTTIWMIMQPVGWTASDSIVGTNTGASNAHALKQRTASPIIGAVATAAVDNGGLAVGAWGRVMSEWSNNAADRLICRSTTATGNAGAVASTGRRIGKSSLAGDGFSSILVAEILYINRLLTAGEFTALNNYTTARYGAGLV